MRKHLRQMVRMKAERSGMKASTAVHNWRRILGAYPGFVGQKRQPKGSKQPVLIYPMPVETVRSLRKAGLL